MAMEPNLATSMQPMYDPRRVNITQQQQQQHPKPDSTVPSPPGAENKVEAANEHSTLADLASSEISLDLQVGTGFLGLSRDFCKNFGVFLASGILTVVF